MAVNPMTGSGTPLAAREAMDVHRGAKLSAHAPNASKEAEASKLKQAAQQFESIFVRQLLKNSKITGSMGDSGYGSMALEALSNGVTERGGLGLAKAIEDSIRSASHAGPQAHATHLPKRTGAP